MRAALAASAAVLAAAALVSGAVPAHGAVAVVVDLNGWVVPTAP